MSRTSKPSKPSESDSELWAVPSGLKPGDVVTVVDSQRGATVTGRVISADRGLGCRLRPVDSNGVTMAEPHQYIQDKQYIVKEVNGNEVY